VFGGRRKEEVVEEAALVNVFAVGEGGGNPTPIVLDASGYDEAGMLALTRRYGLESTFVVPPTDPSAADYRFRFFVPRQEMNMCGHATVGTLWLLRRVGRLRGVETRVETGSGTVRGFVREAGTAAEYVEITQPAGRVEAVTDRAARRALLEVLGLDESALAPRPIQNAVTSRMKSLVPLRSVELLDSLRPDFARMEEVCERLHSTGLYPYAAHSPSERIYDARQFPKASGFPEDVATGVAATALLFGLLACGEIPCDDRRLTVRQGRAMGRPSEIFVRFDLPPGAARPAGCFLGGRARPAGGAS
jgi:PhzF family phenazine biosynthesis protein